MSETVKTSLFAAAALVVGLAAFGSVYLTQPADVDIASEIGKPLFPDFTDPLKGASLEIVSADEKLAKLNRFEVEHGSDGRWVIPSHGGYPADAENRIRDAAVPLTEMKILGVASNRSADHELFGVVEPTTENAGKEGVGTLIAMQDEGGKDLVRLVVGEKVKGQDKQRFVRRPSQDRVYAVEINLEAFPAKFEDWIEKDLLKLNPLDLKKLTINDYSASAKLDLRQGALRLKENRRMDLTVTSDNSKWTLDELTLYRNNQPQSSGLLPEEELNDTKLNDLKNGLDELTIADVRRKPKGLGADLKAERGFLEDNEGVNSLLELGFIPVSGRNEKVDLLGANGEVVSTLSNGVEYVLKFGDVAGAEESTDADKLNRYLLVMVRVNEDMIPKPVLAELPPLPEGPAPAAKTETGDSSCGAQEESQPPAEPAAEPTKKADETPEAKNADPAAAPAEPAEPAAKEAPKKPADDRAKIDAERERITKENQRKEDDYQSKLKDAQKQVRDLNYRFADWYYVVSEDVFKKIRLTRGDAIKDKTAVDEQGFDVDAFRKLEVDGLKKTPAAKPE